jgi:hypothetical protein
VRRADAHALDRMVRSTPETAYEPSFLQALQTEGISSSSRR